jgi:hypothetical protein
MREFATLVDRGIADLEALLGSALPPAWRRLGRLRYEVTDRIGMSRTYGRTVLLPLARVRARRAPYLHETVHALLPARSDCLWLSEGLASYLESWVSENRGGYDGQVFSRAGDRGIHRDALRHLQEPGGRAVLPFVGVCSQPPDLETERRRVARPYYVLSHSLSKYLVDNAGLDVVVRLLSERDVAAALASATRRDPEEWRRAWLQSIGAGD